MVKVTVSKPLELNPRMTVMNAILFAEMGGKKLVYRRKAKSFSANVLQLPVA